jgi:3',5'-cyclic AMP phosphodiesterase CpdA
MPVQSISWLHISDLHLQADTWDSDIVLKELARDVESEMAESRLTFDFLFVTGDVAYSGKEKEYQNAKAFLNNLWNVTGLGPSSTYIVPGNHDVSRKVYPLMARDRRRDLTNPAKVDEYVASSELKSIFRRQRNFQKFVKESCGRDPNRFGCFEVDRIRRKDLSIIGLNSAWLSQPIKLTWAQLRPNIRLHRGVKGRS